MLDKSLLVFPLLSGVSCLLVMLTFFAGAFFTGLHRGESTGDDALIWVLFFVYYFVNFFVIVFFNSALVSCAMTRFKGGIPTVGDGLRAATARLPQILAWTLLAATVGVALRMLQERFALLGRIVIALLGAAWAIATYFIVPVLVMEQASPLDAVKRSVSLMKQTWGESLISHVGLGLVTGVIGVLGVLLIVVITAALFMVSSSLGAMIAMIAGFVAIAAFVLLLALVSSVLSSIVLSALYLYAAEKNMPQAFKGMEQFAFAPKQGRIPDSVQTVAEGLKVTESKFQIDQSTPVPLVTQDSTTRKFEWHSMSNQTLPLVRPG